MKTAADIKRRALLGAVITMTHHGWFPNGDLIGVPRPVILVQSNAVAFTPVEGHGKSWLYWPPAKELRVTGPDSFDVMLGETWDKFMSYTFAEKAA